VGSVAPLPLYPRYPLDRLGGTQSQSGQHGEETILDPMRTDVGITLKWSIEKLFLEV
jgi:hypothetical protein